VSHLFTVNPGDIVQADPEVTHWGPCLVVVTDVKGWGIQGFTSMPRTGRAYVRLTWGEMKPTGGVSVFDELKLGAI
jgi:hypothetical protein